jgi:hypothetical protein
LGNLSLGESGSETVGLLNSLVQAAHKRSEVFGNVAKQAVPLPELRRQGSLLPAYTVAGLHENQPGC